MRIVRAGIGRRLIAAQLAVGAHDGAARSLSRLS
jgi:hypothetical protein